MFILEGIKNFYLLINSNWATIVVIIGLVFTVYEKAHSYLEKSTEEKIEIAKKQITETMLKMITEAEQVYENWTKAGSIKRSKVIEEIFEKYPVLTKAVNQEELIQWIDDTIDDALIELRKIIQQNKEVVVP